MDFYGIGWGYQALEIAVYEEKGRAPLIQKYAQVFEEI